MAETDTVAHRPSRRDCIQVVGGRNGYTEPSEVALLLPTSSSNDCVDTPLPLCAITRPAESTSDLDPIDELLRSLNKGKRLQIGPLATSAPFSRPFSNPNSLSLSHPLQALLFPGVIAGFPTCTAGVSLSSRVIHIHVNSKATDSVVPLSEQTQFAL